MAGEYQAIVLNTTGVTYISPLLMAKYFGIRKRVIHSHSAGSERPPGMIKKGLIAFSKMLLRYAMTDFFACSKEAGEWMFGKDRKFRVIHNAIEPATFKYNEALRRVVRENLGISDQFVIGHVGAFFFAKNHSFLLDVFYEVWKNNPTPF